MEEEERKETYNHVIVSKIGKENAMYFCLYYTSISKLVKIHFNYNINLYFILISYILQNCEFKTLKTNHTSFLIYIYLPIIYMMYHIYIYILVKFFAFMCF